MAGLPLLDRVAPGDHICWTVDDDRTRLDAIAAFVQTGLRAREKVIYSGDDCAAVLAGITDRGVAVQEPLRTGQLATETSAESYLRDGVFDPEATIERFRDVMVQARDEGYPGLRAIGDMSWALRRGPGAELLPWYEAAANTLFTDGFLTGVCAYDPRLLGQTELRRLICAHPGAATSTMPYDPDTSLRFRRTREPPGLQLLGEADLSNREALATVVHEAVSAHDATIDLTGLRFVDMAAARTLLTAAAAGPGKLRLVGCSPTLVRLLTSQDAGAVPGLTVEARR